MDDFAEQVLENESCKFRSDRILIESYREANAIQYLTQALEEMIDARNRNAAAMEREARALRDLEDARQFAEVDSRSKRIPAQSANAPQSRPFSIAEKSVPKKRKRG